MANGTVNDLRQLNAYVCVFFTFALATITIALRLVARRLTRLKLGLDDYLAIVAFAFAGGWTGLTLWWLKLGLGLHLEDIEIADAEVLPKSRLILWNIELVYAFSLAFAKLAILAFYWRMFKTSNIKTPIKVLAGCAIVWLILRTFMAIFHCVPVQRFWMPEIEGVCNIDDSKFFFGTVLAHLIIDIAILALPAIEVLKIQLPISQRLGVLAMFMFGIFVCVASVVVLVYSLEFDTSSLDIPYNISPIITWATVEVNLAIVSACLPMLRPIYLLILRRPLPKNSSSGLRYHSQSRSGNFSSTHKLGKISVSKVNQFDNSSTHELARPSGDGSFSSRSDDNVTGIHTVVSGPGDADSGEGRKLRKGKQGDEARWSGIGDGIGKIVVTNEMSVRSERVG